MVTELEKYREKDGHINMDSLLKESMCVTQAPFREIRGSQNREKDWVEINGTDFLLRTENMRDLGVYYTSYAELLTEEVAKQVGLPCAHYDLIKYKGEFGVLSQNVLENKKESELITAASLIANSSDSMTVDDTLDFINIEDLYSSLNYFNSFENIGKENLKKLKMDSLKLAIFDIFTLNTDRNGGNFSFIYRNGNLTLAPIYDNEHSFCGGCTTEQLKGILTDNSIAKIESEDMTTVLEAPQDYQEELEEDWEFCSPIEEDCKKVPLNWQTMLFFLNEMESEELNDFVKNCHNNINISNAFENVEKRIGTKVPSEYKESVEKIYSIRKDYIEKVIDIEEEKEKDEDANCLE